MPTLLDFHIHPESSDHFRLEVFARGGTQPLATATFAYRLDFMTEYVLNRLDVDRNDPVGRMERLTEFGADLYQKLFTEAVQRVWNQQKAKSDFIVLCIRIDPKVAGLEALPWETLHDGEEFLAAGAKTGVSRLPLDVPPQANLSPFPPPLKMLAFAASPLDLDDNRRHSY